MEERIQKILSQQGICSRRAAEQMILDGRVRRNGRPVLPGEKVDPARDELSVDGRRLQLRRQVEKRYYLLHKPRGFVTTLSDRHAKRNVGELVGDIGLRLFPVGRLDKDSEGLLIMTNDGDFSNLITHPSWEISKTYRVSVKPAATEQQLSTLASGVAIEGGTTAPASVRVTGDVSEKTVFEITLKEGRNREVRRMCEAVGLTVTRLKRTAVGSLRLGQLACGAYRELTKQEVAALKGAAKKAERGKSNAGD